MHQSSQNKVCSNNAWLVMMEWKLLSQSKGIQHYCLLHFKCIIRQCYMLLDFMPSNLESQGHVLLDKWINKSIGRLCHGKHSLSIRIQKWMWHVALHQSHLSIMKHTRQKREFFNTGFCMLCVSEHSYTINAKRFGNRTNTPLSREGMRAENDHLGAVEISLPAATWHPWQHPQHPVLLYLSTYAIMAV